MNPHGPSITRCNQPLKNISNIRVRTAGSDQMAKRRKKTFRSGNQATYYKVAS